MDDLDLVGHHSDTTKQRLEDGLRKSHALARQMSQQVKVFKKLTQSSRGDVEDVFRRGLFMFFEDDEITELFLPRVETISCSTGQSLLECGASPQDLLMITKGKLQVSSTLSGASTATIVRVLG